MNHWIFPYTSNNQTLINCIIELTRTKNVTEERNFKYEWNQQISVTEWKTKQDGFARGEEEEVDAIEKQIYEQEQAKTGKINTLAV